MSYGNYYYMQRDFTDGEWEQIQQATFQIANAALDKGIKLEHVLVSSTQIEVAGCLKEHCETFRLIKTGMSKLATYAMSCTTNRQPYDKVVKSILYEASQIAPDVFESLFCDDEPTYGGYKDRDTIYWQFQNYFKELE